MNQRSNKPARQQTENLPASQTNDWGVRLHSDITGNQKLFADLLGGADEKSVNRFMAGAFQAIRKNLDLVDADRLSLMMSLGEAAALGLSPNPGLGECWLIPRWDNHLKCQAVSFQTGVYGLVKLVNRGTLIDDIHWNVVRRGEHWRNFGGTLHRLEHEIPTEGVDETDEGILASYASILLRGSSKPFEKVVSRAKLIESAKKSGDPRNEDWSNVWVKNFEPMCLVVALRRACKVIPGADEARSAISREDARGRDEQAFHDRVLEVFQGQQKASHTQQSKGLDSVLADAPVLPRRTNQADPNTEPPEGNKG